MSLHRAFSLLPQRPGGGLRRTLVVALLLGTAFGSAAAVGQAQPGQILRPDRGDAGSATILESDRVARLILQLPVELEVAYDAWTDASQLVEWLPHWAEMQVVEGGTFEIGWEGFEGSWTGTYLEVDRPTRLAFSWLPPEQVFPGGAYETRVSLSFDEVEDGRTTMTLEHSGFRGVDEMEEQLQAWRAYLFALRAFLLQPPVRDGV